MPLSLLVTGALLLFGIVQISCLQQLYTQIPERCEFKNVNASLIDLRYFKCIKKSRLELLINISIVLKVDIRLDDDEQIRVTGYQFRSNEYRKGPIEFTVGGCSGMNSKQFDIPEIMRHTNLKGCPLLKGKEYYGYNIAPNATNMPPFLPDGRWMFEIKSIYQNKYEIGRLEWYTTIEYPIRIFSKRKYN